MKWLRIVLPALMLAGLLAGCNLEKEIEIELPAYESKIVVECYLEPGKPYQMLLSRSAAYFAPFDTSSGDLINKLLVSGAKVSISHRGGTVELANQLVVDPDATKIYNYYNVQPVPANYNEDFTLLIELPDGTTITGETQILVPVPFDSIRVEFNESDSLARVLTYFTDIPDQSNYYRRMLHRHSLDTLALQDFTLDDRFVEDVVVFGTGYEFELGNTAINTLFHIDRSYYDFLESVSNAVQSNGNPFGQPSPIFSNLTGTARSTGIFTGLSYTRQETLIQ